MQSIFARQLSPFLQRRIMTTSATRTTPSVSDLRKDTPGCQHVVHFNNAGCALPCRRVIEATDAFYEKEVLYGGYETTDASQVEEKKAYHSLSRLINCRPDEVAILPSATSAWQQVVFGIQFKPNDVVLTSPNEYGSNYINFLQLKSRAGIQIEIVPEDSEGDIDLEKLEEMCAELKPKLISLTHVPSSSGAVYDAEGVGKIARKHQAIYLLDACQSAGQVPLDVRRIDCDFLSATSRKFLRGPRGVGFLYAAERTRDYHEPACLDNRSARWTSMTSYTIEPTARRYEQFEMNKAAKVGFGVAVEYCLEVGMEWIAERVRMLADRLRHLLRENPDVHVWDKESTLCGIVSFTMDRHSPNAIKDFLAERKINVATSTAYTTRIKMEEEKLDAIVRASVHYYNTEEELEKFAETLKTID